MATPTDSKAIYNPQILRGRDSFFTTVYRFFDGIAKHRAGVWIVLGALIAMGVAGGLWANRHESRTEEGKSALFQAQKAYETELKTMAGVKPPVSVPPAPKTDKADSKAKEAADQALKAQQAEEAAATKRMEDLSFQKLDVTAKFPLTVKKYQEVMDQFGKTRTGFEARMSLGDLFFKHGESAKALPLFKEAAEMAPSHFEKALALSALGYSNENTGNPSAALPAFEKALNLGEASLKGDLLLAIARSHEALHDTAKARSTYDQIISQLPNTEVAKSAEALKAQLH